MSQNKWKLPLASIKNHSFSNPTAFFAPSYFLKLKKFLKFEENKEPSTLQLYTVHHLLFQNLKRSQNLNSKPKLKLRRRKLAGPRWSRDKRRRVKSSRSIAEKKKEERKKEWRIKISTFELCALHVASKRRRERRDSPPGSRLSMHSNRLGLMQACKRTYVCAACFSGGSDTSTKTDCPVR